MKKTFTLSLALAFCLAANADSVKTFTAGTGVPGMDFPDFMGLGISPDGKYICGASDLGAAIFVANTETGEFKWSIADSDDGGELRNVDNSGLAIGVANGGILYSFDNPEEKHIKSPAGYSYVLGNDLTPDASIMCGSLVGGQNGSVPVISKDGAQTWLPLPVPTGDQLHGVDVREGGDARFISTDGKTILGHLGSFTMPIVWKQNDAGEYEADFFPARYLKLTEADMNDASKPLYGLSAFYTCMSDNGRYVAFRGLIIESESDQELSVPVVYDTEKKEIKVYDKLQPMDEYAFGLYPQAITNDGTFIGTVGQPFFNSHGSYIMRAGSDIAELWIDAFPAYEEKFGVAESNGFNVPVAITGDGRYILGYAFYCEDYLDPNAAAYYLTYIIDTEGSAGIENVKMESTDAVPAEIYNINGHRLREMTTGVNIVRMSDGSVRKIVKK